MEINDNEEGGGVEHLNLNYTDNNDSFNNVSYCNNKEQTQNQNTSFINIQNHVCANCSKLLQVTYPSTLINEYHLIQPQEKEEGACVENNFIFEIEIIEDLNHDNDDLPSTSATVTVANANEKSKSVQRIKVHEILSSIYSLNFLLLLPCTETDNAYFLNDLNDPRRMNDVKSDLNSTAVNQEYMCLCLGCAQVLTNLYKYYTQFNQLRTFDSILSKKIHRLDQILENRSYCQNQHQTRSQSQFQSQCESDSFAGSVVKCEVLTEEGADKIIFDEYDDNSHNHNNLFGAAQIEFDENESNFGDRQDQDVGPFQPDTDRKTSPDPINIVHENSSATLNSESSGPWVRLSRLRSARFGSPVFVSKKRRSDNYGRPNQEIHLEKREKIRKLNTQADDGYIDFDLVSSGPSDNDNSNDSDFLVESDVKRTNRERKTPVHSKRKPKTTKTTKNSIEAQELNPENISDDQGNSHSGHNASRGHFLSIYTSSSDSEPEPIIKKSISKTKRNSKTKSKTKTATKIKSKNKASRKSRTKTKTKSKSKAASDSDDPDNEDAEENAETGKYRPKGLKTYRRRKARVANPCWHCPLDFPTQEECAAHTKATHFSPGDFFCLECSKLCPNKKSYSQHLTICEKLCPGQKLAPYLCPHCGKSFPYKYYLDSHLPVHNEENSFSCSGRDCTFEAKSQLLINLHFNRMHVEQPKFKVGEDGELNLSEPIIHKCDHCGATFKNDHSRRIHMHNLHDPEGYRKYREYMDALLARQKVERRLKTKENESKGNKTFICPDCNIDFFSYLRLIGHRKAMHKVSTAACVCDQCGKDFARQKSLKTHMKFVHTDIRPFICEHCGKTFKTSYNLKDHVSRTHSEEGRIKYNDLMRRKNQRRKIVADALLAKKIATATTTNTFEPEHNLTRETVKDESYINPNFNPLEYLPRAPSSAVNPIPVPGPSSETQRLTQTWVPHS